MLLNQGFLLVKLKSSLLKLYSRHHDLINRYGKSVSQMATDMFHFPALFLIHDVLPGVCLEEHDGFH